MIGQLSFKTLYHLAQIPNLASRDFLWAQQTVFYALFTSNFTINSRMTEGKLVWFEFKIFFKKQATTIFYTKTKQSLPGSSLEIAVN